MSTSGNVYLATHRLIDSVWTISYEPVNGGVYVHSYSRQDKRGYQVEGSVPVVKKHESPDRTLESITLTTKKGFIAWLPVVNQRHIFSYPLEDVA